MTGRVTRMVGALACAASLCGCEPGLGETFAASPCADRAPAEGPSRTLPAAPGRVRIVTSGYGDAQRDGLAAPDGTVLLPRIYDALAPTGDPDLFAATCRATDAIRSNEEGFVDADGREVIPPVFWEARRLEDGRYEVSRWVGFGPFERVRYMTLDAEGRVVEVRS